MRGSIFKLDDVIALLEDGDRGRKRHLRSEPNGRTKLARWADEERQFAELVERFSAQLHNVGADARGAGRTAASPLVPFV